MPNFDKTGPAGAGPGTGFGRGVCVGAKTGPALGRGMANRRGMFGRRSADLSLAEEEQMLKQRLEAIGKIKSAAKAKQK